MNRYQLDVGYSFEDKRFRRLFPLFKKVFNMDEKTIRDFYNRDFWNSSYCPYTYFDGEIAISNVAMYDLSIIINGEITKVAGIQSVMTHPEYRHRGLMRELLLKLLQKVDGEYHLAFLFTDIPELYIPYGFRVVKEHFFIIYYDHLPNCANNSLRKMNFFHEDDNRFINKKIEASHVLSKKFTSLNDKHSFYLSMLNPKFSENLFYIDHLDIVIVFMIEEETLKIFDVIGEKIPTLEEICVEIPRRFHRIEFYFNPDLLGVSSVESRLYHSPNFFMVRGNFPFENEKFILKRTGEF